MKFIASLTRRVREYVAYSLTPQLMQTMFYSLVHCSDLPSTLDGWPPAQYLVAISDAWQVTVVDLWLWFDCIMMNLS